MREEHIHLISDSSGETVEAVARACISQFQELTAKTHAWMLVRESKHLARVLEAVRAEPGPVLYTLVDPKLVRQLEAAAGDLGLPCLPVLDPILHSLAQYFGVKSLNRPGLQHELDRDYFRRIEAMDFALSHDDGHATASLGEAQVILVGVSRTSKTPTCLYLANRGVRAANVPLVAGLSPPPALLEAARLPSVLAIGLTKDPEHLVQIRQNRLQSLGAKEVKSAYADPEAVKEELLCARRLFTREGWPVIDVTKRSIEETAAAILTLLAERVGKEHQKIL